MSQKHSYKGVSSGHFVRRVASWLVLGFVFAWIASFAMDPDRSNAGKVLTSTENQRYLFGFVLIFGALTLIFTLVSWLTKKFRLTSLMLLITWVIGGVAAVAVVVYDTPASLRYDSLAKANECTALVITDSGHGSGFSTNDGYLVTNNHVIEGSDKITVHYSSDMVATVVATSAELDIAVLKIPETIPVCKWADSSGIKRGSELYAVGWPYNPYGEPTTTKGIYSRTVTPNEATDVLGLSNSEYIQTDAVINPGNSGGPLVDTDGVIGVNTGKLSSTDSTDIPEGLGYAISSNWAKPFVDNSIKSQQN